MIKRLLYLTYIDLESAPTTGSSVRPLKMKEAFESLEKPGVFEVKTFGGPANDIPLRRKVVGEIREFLRHWRPDACYIEPPSGPFFFEGDVTLIRDLCKARIPTAIFYRDAYWRYPEFSAKPGINPVNRMKRIAIKRMSAHQWKVFRDNLSLIYFPSMTMADEFDCPRKDTLPPGCFVADVPEKTDVSVPLQCLFVGAAAKDHGTFLTLDAFSALNKDGVKAKLFYICPEDQWASLGVDSTPYRDWLEVIHTSGDENLRPYYEQTDIALLTAPRSFYRNFAVPVKLYEYMSYGKPMLVTNCTETVVCVKRNRVGWVAKDRPDSVAEKLSFLCENPDEIRNVRENMSNARERNRWRRRAEKVVRDLSGVR